MKNKTIVYIAGKINGYADFKEKFRDAETLLKKLGFAVLNPAELPHGLEYEQYMDICFAMLDQADIIFLLDNYEDSPGALRELEKAKDLGLKIIGANYKEE